MASWHPDEPLAQGTVDERTEARLHAHRGEQPYLHAPLGSRKAPPPPGPPSDRLGVPEAPRHVSGHRLFTVKGKPTLNEQERHLLDEARRIMKAVDYARAELLDAIDTDDVELCVSACRRFLALGGLLGDKARFAS